MCTVERAIIVYLTPGTAYGVPVLLESNRSASFCFCTGPLRLREIFGAETRIWEGFSFQVYCGVRRRDQHQHRVEGTRVASILLQALSLICRITVPAGRQSNYRNLFPGPVGTALIPEFISSIVARIVPLLLWPVRVPVSIALGELQV